MVCIAHGNQVFPNIRVFKQSIESSRSYLSSKASAPFNHDFVGAKDNHIVPRPLSYFAGLGRFETLTLAALTSLALTTSPENCVAATTPGSWKPPRDLTFSIFDDYWIKEETPSFPPGSFSRLDSTLDTKFYETPRFVEHIDERAVSAITRFHDVELKKQASELGRSLDVLDLCASHVSHVSPDLVTSGVIRTFCGLGLNQQELDSNPLLTRRLLHDLNKAPSFGTREDKDGSIDVVLLQLSIDYLTRPIEVLTEVGRLLRPGGYLHVSFSNRVFLTKCVGVWSGKGDDEHIETVGDYMKATREYSMPPRALDITPMGDGRVRGQDPLYVVSAQRL